MFHIYCSQELFQSTEKVYNEIVQITNIFPNSAFLQTQRALLHYHSKGVFVYFALAYTALTKSRIRRGRCFVR
jgi:hypothetical protein